MAPLRYRACRFQKASALMMLGDKVAATEAERTGMIYKIFADEIFVKDSLEIAKTLSQMPTKALAYTKSALNASFNNSLEQQLKKEDELQLKAANTIDYKEGIASFIEKRMPRFIGE
ncbi:MAG: enoyl-CoA hydratase-related protein [Ferruginibacter sp.]